MITLERIEKLAHAYREPVMLMYSYEHHSWTVWIGLSGCKGIYSGLDAGGALQKAEAAYWIQKEVEERGESCK